MSQRNNGAGGGGADRPKVKSFRAIAHFDKAGEAPLFEVGAWSGNLFISLTPVHKSDKGVSLVTQQKVFCSLYDTDRYRLRWGLSKLIKGEISAFAFIHKTNMGNTEVKFGINAKNPDGYVKLTQYNADGNEDGSLGVSFAAYATQDDLGMVIKPASGGEAQEVTPQYSVLHEILAYLGNADVILTLLEAAGHGKPAKGGQGGGSGRGGSFSEGGDEGGGGKRATGGAQGSPDDDDLPF